MLKALKYKSSLSFRAFQKKIVEFTDSTPTIYWSTNIAKKAANCWKKSFYISVLNTLQYKQCLRILTLSKCNAYFIDQIWIIYRPEEKISYIFYRPDITVKNYIHYSFVKNTQVLLIIYIYIYIYIYIIVCIEVSTPH